MKWSEFLDEMRVDIQDTGPTPRVTDKALWMYAKDAVRDYSSWFPLRIDREGIPVSNGAFPLPLRFIEEIHVEAPLDTHLRRHTPQPGSKYNAPSSAECYAIQGRGLYVPGPTPGTVYLTYHATHPVPTSESDAEFEFTVPDGDIELIRLYVKARAFGMMRTRQATLDRFKPVGARDDNPLQPETENFMSEYHRGIAQRIRGGVITLYVVK